jgi:hypothetical protein
MHGPDHLQTATFYYMRCFLVEKSGRVSLTLYFKIDFTFLGCYCFNLKWLRFLLFVFLLLLFQMLRSLAIRIYYILRDALLKWLEEKLSS